MPKTGDTRTHCMVESRVCNNLPQPPPYTLVFGGCGRLLHTLDSTVQCVNSCVTCFWHGVIPTSYFIFNDFYTCSAAAHKLSDTESVEVHQEPNVIDLPSIVSNIDSTLTRATQTLVLIGLRHRKTYYLQRHSAKSAPLQHYSSDVTCLCV